jgi:hypothetical protein
VEFPAWQIDGAFGNACGTSIRELNHQAIVGRFGKTLLARII